MKETLKGALVGSGRTADVFAWGSNRVIKLFHAGTSPESCQREYAIGRAVHDECGMGPAVFELSEVEGRNGIVYERLVGENMLSATFQRLYTLPSMANTFASLHHTLHQKKAPEILPVGKALLRAQISKADMGSALKDQLYTLLNSLPEGDRLLHMDYHPGNIILSPQGPVVIDWLTACRGVPAMDIARTAMMLSGADLPEGGALKQALGQRLGGYLHSRYLKYIMALSGLPRREIGAWMLPVMGARLAENIPGKEHGRLYEYIKKSLL